MFLLEPPGREGADLPRLAHRAGVVPALLLASLAACGGTTGPGESPGVSAAPAPEAARAPAPTFPTQNRPDVRGVHGAVSADHPLAAAAGYDVLRRGGSATDAAVAMAAVLSVVRPHMNGVGGDAFALFYDAGTGDVTALNGSGRAGSLATPGFFRDAGEPEVPGTAFRSPHASRPTSRAWAGR